MITLTAKNQMFFALNYIKKILYTYPSDQELGPLITKGIIE